MTIVKRKVSPDTWSSSLSTHERHPILTLNWVLLWTFIRRSSPNISYDLIFTRLISVTYRRTTLRNDQLEIMGPNSDQTFLSFLNENVAEINALDLKVPSPKQGGGSGGGGENIIEEKKNEYKFRRTDLTFSSSLRRSISGLLGQILGERTFQLPSLLRTYVRRRGLYYRRVVRFIAKKGEKI